MGEIKENFQIFKSLTEQAHAKNLADGNLILKSANYYRIHPDQNIRDFDEFTCRSAQGSTSLTNPALIFCCHKSQPSSAQPFAVRINTPCNLFNEIKSRLGAAVYPSNHAYFGDVIYRQMRGDSPDASPFPKVTFYCENGSRINDSVINCVYSKDIQFRKQNKIRMCFLVCSEKLLANCIEVKFYKRGKNESIDYNTWRNDEKNAQNWDNYWFEVHLKVEESNFTLIND